MKTRTLLLAAVMVAVFYCGCREGKKRAPVIPQAYECKYDDPANVDENILSVAESNNEFAVDLYAQLKSNAGNLFFSPASISTALAMTYAGADGQTATEMHDTLCFTLPEEELHENFGKLVDVLTTERARTVLSIANSLWGQQGYSFLQSFLDLLNESYLAPMHEVDYAGATEEARLAINAWVEEQTNGKIVDLLKPGTIGALTRLVLTNAIYFKSDWKNKFDPADTATETFNVTSSQTVQAEMMKIDKQYMNEHDDLRFNTYFGSGFSMLELPYERDIFSMIILLPDDVDGLAALEDSLTHADLSTWISSLAEGELYEIKIPKFEFTSEFSLKPELSAMGMPTAFDETLADFSGINGGAEQLFISNVVHKAYVKVNEEGTEAAAATAVIINTTSMPPSFIADHPFLFLIRHNATGTILFMGRVTDPTQ